MAKVISATWTKDILQKLDNNQDIDVTTEFTKAIQFLIVVLTKRSIPYKIFNLGAGVKRLTTSNIDICPCCHKKL